MRNRSDRPERLGTTMNSPQRHFSRPLMVGFHEKLTLRMAEIQTGLHPGFNLGAANRVCNIIRLAFRLSPLVVKLHGNSA